MKFLNFFQNLFDENQRKLNDYGKIVDRINDLEPEIKALSDDDLAAQTAKFKKRIASELKKGREEEEILEEILPEAFATVRETSRRITGMRHYDVQLLAGIALHRGDVTEQKTGEGKTLTVTAPLYLNALLGKGAHLITVNDYLAEIGAGWMGPIYDFLELSSAVVVHDTARLYDPEYDGEDRGDERLEHFRTISRQKAYAADITYGTNNEFGFDYLRDNMVQELDQMVQRHKHPHHFAIVDEADSILIDEARTPLIISAPDAEPTEKYHRYSQMIQGLSKGQDFEIDEKAKSVSLTDLGVKRIEQKLGVDNLYEESFDTIHHVETALKAKTLYTRDDEYIVRDDQVIIVDEHTGRLMYGRRFSDGLHQAIEAKEKVTVQQESRTLATISIQNYFRMYNKLAGMTGTAATEAEEFRHIYNMDVLVVPTNKPVIRDDRDDIVYKTQAAKYGAIAAEAERVHEQGRPILIGTRSIEHNQVISNFLKRKGVDHKVLNAKNNEKEAFIIADAGKKNAITVATNIAGRGVDIVLGGAKPELKDYRLAEDDRPEEAPDVPDNVTIPPSVNPRNYNLEAYSTALSEWKTDHDEVIDLGGLHIVGTERHESRRIDNQLRGRAGRQGDPGSSQFFVSLEDDIMRIFGGEQIAQIMDFLKVDEHQPIEHGMIGKSIESAQVKVETFFFDQRKRLVQFDDVMNKQREIIYERRRRLLDVSTAETELIDTESDESRAVDHDSISKAEERRLEQAADVAEASRSLKEQILGYVRDEVATVVMLRAPESFTEEEYDAIIKEFSKIIPFDDRSQKELQKKIDDIVDPFEIEETLFEIAKETYEQKEKSIGDEQMRQLERAVMLSTIDQKWMDHIDEMQNLRDGIWLRGDKQTVLSEYKKEGFAMFEALVDNIESSIASKVYRIQIQKQPQPVVDLSKVKERKDNINESLDKEVQDATPPTPEQAGVPRNTQGSSSDMAAALGGSRRSAAKRASKSIGRNDQCPCGSGLKYKECGLIEAAEHQA